jgi:GNAT superfamily N-acetyltransferase
VSWSVRRASDDLADLAAIARVVNVATPDNPSSVEEMRWSDATYPGTARFLAEEAGQAVGSATAGRIYMYPPDFPALWGAVEVVPDARRHGIGAALLLAISDHTRSTGKAALHISTSGARPEALAFLRRHGFEEYERSKTVRLELSGRRAPPIDPLRGVQLTSLEERPELVAGVHAVAIETFPDIPGGGEPVAAGDLTEFRARDVDRPSIPRGGFAIAVETETGRVIGYASLIFLPGSTTVAWHDMTAVLRDWRGRGLAGALKRATIAWALDHNLEALETGNDDANAPMRAVNARLGYRPLPDEVTMRGLAVEAAVSA